MQILPTPIFTSTLGQKAVFVKNKEYGVTKEAVQILGSIDFDTTQFDVTVLPNGILVGLRADSSRSPEYPKSFKISAVSNANVTVLGGTIRYHGKYISTMADTTIEILGGTITNPTYVYATMPWITRVITLNQSILEPQSNNTELNIPLFTCYLEGNLVVIKKVLYDGDVQISSPISG